MRQQIEGAAVGNRGYAYFSLGQYAKAAASHHAALAIRREIGEWTGRVPANVPMHWPSAEHLFQAQDNMESRELGVQPLYQWGQVMEPPNPIWAQALATAPRWGWAAP